VAVPATVLALQQRKAEDRSAVPAGLQTSAARAVGSTVARAYLALGYAYLQQNKPTESLLPLAEAARLDPKNDGVQNNLCFALKLLGHTQEARAACERALELNPANQLARNNLSWVNGPSSGAAPAAPPPATPPPPPAAPPALAAPSQPEDELLQRGLALYQQGEFQQSIDVWQQALAMNPRSARACNNIGTGQMKLGRFAEAQAMFERAISLEPGAELFKNNLAWAKSERAMQSK
jgi:Flp pilus assembly protein TadD